MFNISQITIFFGVSMLVLALINSITGGIVADPQLERAEIIACLSSIILIGTGIWSNKIVPTKFPKANLKGRNGLFIEDSLPSQVKDEIAWGTHNILIATAASTILIYLNGKTILRRGIINDQQFNPDKICKQTRDKGKLLSLANTKNYPGSFEFDSVVENLPSVLIYPLSTKGFVIVGGWTPRCFTNSDEIWISNWSERLLKLIE